LRANEISSLACTCKRFAGLFDTLFWRTFCEQACPPNLLQKILSFFGSTSLNWFQLSRILTVCPNEAIIASVFNDTQFLTPNCPRQRDVKVVKVRTEHYIGLEYAFIYSKCVHKDGKCANLGGFFLKEDRYIM
jgi:hypothetical protein